MPFGEIWDIPEKQILKFVVDQNSLYPKEFRKSKFFEYWVNSGGKKPEEKSALNQARTNYQNYYMDTDYGYRQQYIHSNDWNYYLQSKYDYDYDYAPILLLAASNEPIQSSPYQNSMDVELLIICAISFVFLFALCASAFALCFIYNFIIFHFYQKESKNDDSDPLDSV